MYISYSLLGLYCYFGSNNVTKKLILLVESDLYIYIYK